MASLFMSSPAPSFKLASYTCTEGGPHRTSSRTLSWNASGSFLALGGSDRVARIFAVDTSSAAPSSASSGGGGATAGVREVLVISHASPVTKVRFNPSSATQLATAAADKSVRLWDVRGATQRALGSLTLVSGNAPVSLEWCPTRPHLLCVTEQDGTISLYDVRAINSGSSNSSSSASNTSAASTSLPTKLRPRPGAVASISTGDDFPESCIFSPCGSYLLSDCNVDGSGRIRIWKCDDLPNALSKDGAPMSVKAVASYPSHAPIYAMGFSPDQSTLVTGGADSVVGLWDRPTMICRAVVARHAKLIRSVAFTPDSRIVATATEELVDLADAMDGSLVAQVSSSGQKVGSARHVGAEEIAFQPNALSSSSYVLACARSDNPLSPTPLSVLRLNVADGGGGIERRELQ